MSIFQTRLVLLFILFTLLISAPFTTAAPQPKGPPYCTKTGAGTCIFAWVMLNEEGMPAMSDELWVNDHACNLIGLRIRLWTADTIGGWFSLDSQLHYTIEIQSIWPDAPNFWYAGAQYHGGDFWCYDAEVGGKPLTACQHAFDC